MYVRALAPMKEKASARAPALRRLAVVGINLGLLLGIAGAAHAAGSGMPWEEPLQQVLESVQGRSEEHTSELQSLMRISYAVFCLKKKKKKQRHYTMIYDRSRGTH